MTTSAPVREHTTSTATTPAPVTSVALRPVPRPAEGHWPDLAVLPPSTPRTRVSARVARSLFLRAVGPLDVRVVFPDGSRHGAGGADSPTMRIVRPDDFFTRLGTVGLIGFGEAWMVGDWDSTNLPGVLGPMAARMGSLIPTPLQRLRRVVDRRTPHTEVNDLDGARENIHRHYDLSNELFQTFLNETMSYSSAWFTAQGSPDDGEDMTSAQVRKIDGILDMARVGEGSRVLEIGSGWGGLAIRAAARGATVLTVTLSAEQKQLADEQVAKAGFSDVVEVRLQDYREVTGLFDAVVSVEMIEAVGKEYWGEYFRTVDALLAPGGRFGLQSITMGHERMLATAGSYSWIHKYIFPGGIIPSLRAIDEVNEAETSLKVIESRRLGLSYARTLSRWRETFLAHREEVLAQGFDETFIRMWDFYLGYCEAGFATRYLDVWQLSLGRE
ncbi:MAG: cyclopropane-fatty-acyl-phospholipid synthase family protein [Mycobacteriaceae bacterium]